MHFKFNPLSGDSTAIIFHAKWRNISRKISDINIRACAEEVYIFSRELFRFASEIKKVYLTGEIEKQKNAEKN